METIATRLRISRVHDSRHTSSITIPEDIIIDILSRALLTEEKEPDLKVAKSFGQFQLVCKSWRAIINDHYFIEKNIERGKIIRYYIGDTVNLLGREHRFLYGCDGILFMEYNSLLMYYLWNPAIGLSLEVPNPWVKSSKFSFLYIKATQNYRLVCNYRDTEGREGCKIFTPGESEFWRLLPFPDSVGIDGEKLVTARVVLCGENVYCIRALRFTGYTFEDIVSLDVASESFTTIPLPEGVFRNWRYEHAIDWNGKLAIAEIVRDNIEVMVLENHKTHKWCQEKKIIPLSFMKEGSDYDKKDLHLLLVKKDELWLRWRRYKIFTYNITSGICTDIVEPKPSILDNRLYALKHSLVTIPGMQSHVKFEKKIAEADRTVMEYIKQGIILT